MLAKSNDCSTKELVKLINLFKRATRTRMLAIIAKGLVVEIGLSLKDPHKKYFLVKK
ncbi:MAG: hypothetical protein LBL17_05025 [Coxiellaceae bacterium]|jgi:hypothetical protein|nr:hypothetical protein [Coxiellaceae bacterium]